MKSIANLVAIALRLHNQRYDRTHDNFEDLGEREGITNDEALVVREPLMHLIDLEVMDGGNGVEGLQRADTRLSDIYRSDWENAVEDPAFYTKIGSVRVYPEQDIAGLFRRR